MKKKYIGAFILGVIFIFITVWFCLHYFSVNSRNTRTLERQLCATADGQKGLVSELLTTDYDALYVFAPYETKSRMEEKLGFPVRVLEESSSEGCINYLFVKDKKAVGYLFGLPQNIGYCINLQPGEYSRQELEKMAYEVKVRDVGNSYGKPKTYQDYNFYYPDEVNNSHDRVVVQTANAVAEVAVGEEITVDLDGNGPQSVKYSVSLQTNGNGDTTGAQVESLLIDGKEFVNILQKEADIHMDNPGVDCYYIVDLDTSDSYKEIALFDEGPSEDPVTYFLRYQNGSLKYLGFVTDHPISDTCHFQNDGGKAGEVVAKFRLSILQTWYAEGYWKLSGAGKLRFEEQSVYYPIGTYEAELLCELPVYHTPDRDGEFFVVQPGKVTFTATDDKNWVQLETEDGTTGWFYVENYATIADVGKEADEVFSNLFFAD